MFGSGLLTEEQKWLLFVFSGIVICKIVYNLTGLVSSLVFNGFAKLNKKVKLEWKNRGFSTFHALFVATASLYLLILSDHFDEGPNSKNQEISIVNRTSKFADSVLGISVGYFLSDLAMIIYQFPDLGGIEYILHHGLSLYSIIQTLVNSQAQIYIFLVLSSEITTPFVNLRWYLDNSGKKNSKLYIGNGVALFLSWLVARILLFVYFFYHMYTHFDEIKQLRPMGFYSLIAVPPVLALMNVFWFWKIAGGLIRTLSKARRHSE